MSTTQDCISISWPPTPTRNTTPTPNNKPLPSKSTNDLIIYTVLCILLGASIVLLAMSPWTDPKFKVQSATLSRLNATGSELTATWDITLLASNPEYKYGLSFTELQAWVLYRDHNLLMLGETPLRPFAVNKRNQTLVNVKLATVSQSVGDDVGKEMYEDRSRGFMVFSVRVSGYHRQKFFLTRYGCFLVNCDWVYFGFSLNGTGTLIEQKDCEFLHNGGYHSNC